MIKFAEERGKLKEKKRKIGVMSKIKKKILKDYRH
jgi:hypothetical protein